MAQDRHAGMDRTLATILGHTLRIGVMASAVIVLAGGILYLARHGFTKPDYHTFHAASSYSRSLPDIFKNALALNSYGIIQLGLLVLVATPVLRVIFSVIAFAIERDTLYVAATLIVLGVLLYSLFTGGV
jgi:uncharacterized membrane protein